MKAVVRPVIALVLPPAALALYIWVYHAFGLGRSGIIGWLAMLGPTVIGAILLATLPPTLPEKIGAVISYVLIMLSLVFFLGIMLACSFGDCL